MPNWTHLLQVGHSRDLADTNSKPRCQTCVYLHFAYTFVSDLDSFNTAAFFLIKLMFTWQQCNMATLLMLER